MTCVTWHTHTRANTPAFGLEGVEGEARLVDCYDADTCKVLLGIPWAGGAVRLVTLRLEGIDAPEMASKDPREKQLSWRARDRLLNLICPSAFPAQAEAYDKAHIKRVLEERVVLVTVQCKGQDKYGRCLAVLHAGGVCVNEAMRDEGHADSYDGGTKARSWDPRIPKKVSRPHANAPRGTVE